MAPARLRQSIQLWRSQLPAVAPYYAVKCNPDPNLLHALVDAGIHFDCASERELLEVRALARGPLTDRVIYANPCKSARDLAAAKQLGSPVTVVDSTQEVEKLADLGYTGGALVRLAVDDTGSAMPFSSKFGAPRTMVEAIAGVAYARGIQLLGTSFHVGSGCRDGRLYRTAIETSMAACRSLTAAGHQPTTLDIGGGFLSDPADFRGKALHIRGALTKVRETAPGLRPIAEPGRFFAANAFDFFVQVIGKKPSYSAAGVESGWRYTLDDSVYGQFSNILFDQARPRWKRVPREGGSTSRPFTRGVLFGRTCDSLDVIAKSEAMEELEVGDWLWFPHMGAYTRATASEFNGFPTPEVLVLEPHQQLPDGFDTTELRPAAAREEYLPSLSAAEFLKN